MANSQQNRDLAIFQLVVYLLLTPFVLFALIKVGRQIRYVSGWFWPISGCIWLIGFLGLMLASAGLTIGAGLHSTSTTGLILSAIGLCPLFLVVDSVLHETVYSTSIGDHLFFHPVSSILLHLVVVAAAALIGIGANELFSSSDPATARLEDGSHLVKAGVLVFLAIWAWLVVTAVVALKDWRRYSSTRNIVIAIIISLSLLAIRVLFGILEFFLTSTSAFNPINGSIVAKLLMSTLPMMGVAIVLVAAGLFTNYEGTKPEPEPTSTPLTLGHNRVADSQEA